MSARIVRVMQVVVPAALGASFLTKFVAPVALVMVLSVAPSFLLFPPEKSKAQQQLEALRALPFMVTSAAATLCAVVVLLGVLCAKRKPTVRGAGMIVVAPTPPPTIAPPAHGGGGAGGLDCEEELPEELPHLEKRLVRRTMQLMVPPGLPGLDQIVYHLENREVRKIMQMVWQRGAPLELNDIAVSEFFKATADHRICVPLIRPDIFNGLRSPPKGLLLYGPPGPSKAIIAQAIAHESGATLFFVSASSLPREWAGNEERMAKTLFLVARCHQPAVIYIDEVASVLSVESPDEASWWFKILLQQHFDSIKAAHLVQVIAATSLLEDLDASPWKMFEMQLHVPLPNTPRRRQLISILVSSIAHDLTAEDVEEIVQNTEGFSGADLHILFLEAARESVHSLGKCFHTISVDDLPPVKLSHVTNALQNVGPGDGAEETEQDLSWNEQFALSWQT